MKKTSISRSIIYFLAVSCFLCSCSDPPIDTRSVIPADALVYLETRDLGKAISAITDNEKFRTAAKTAPNVSPLNGMKLSVAVTGFETKEDPVDGEGSVLNFQPRFVAVLETNAWNFQANSFAENKLGEFINDTYGGDVELMTSSKYDGKFYTWTAKDGRKAFALVQGSVVYFGNDVSAIEKCQAVKRGEADPIAGNEKLDNADRLASGFVSREGMAQLSNIIGISLAMNAGEDTDIRSFVARVLPEILRNSVDELTWESTKTENGISDRYAIDLNNEIVEAAKISFAKSGTAINNFAEFVPQNAASATRYDLSDPKVAWQKIVETVRSRTDAISGNLIGLFASSVFEPYAIADPEKFLGSISGRIMTVKLNAEDENTVVIAEMKNVDEIKASLIKDIFFTKPSEKRADAEIWRSDDGEFAAAFVGRIIIVGDAATVMKCLTAKESGENITKLPLFDRLNSQTGTSVTTVRETDPEAKLIEALGGRKDPDAPLVTRSFTTTSFENNEIKRETFSDFGLIGMIIEQFSKDNTQ